jgi:hypothetical protein
MITYKITYIIDNSQIVGPSEEVIQGDWERTRRTGLKNLFYVDWRCGMKRQIW